MIMQALGHAHNVNKPLPCARPSPPFPKGTPIAFGVTVTIPLNLKQSSSNKRNKWRGPAAGGEQAVYAGLMLERRVRFSSYRCSTAIKLSEEPLLEAKRLLLHSELSIAEIGYELGFEDPSYFSRFIRREIETSPVELRHRIREKYRKFMQ